jgi:hypothetical protein
MDIMGLITLITKQALHNLGKVALYAISRYMNFP